MKLHSKHIGFIGAVAIAAFVAVGGTQTAHAADESLAFSTQDNSNLPKCKTVRNAIKGRKCKPSEYVKCIYQPRGRRAKVKCVKCRGGQFSNRKPQACSKGTELTLEEAKERPKNPDTQQIFEGILEQSYTPSMSISAQ